LQVAAVVVVLMKLTPLAAVVVLADTEQM